MIMDLIINLKMAECILMKWRGKQSLKNEK